MGFKGFLALLFVLALVYFGIGLYLAFSVESLSDISKFEVVRKMPKFLFETIKNWVMGS